MTQEKNTPINEHAVFSGDTWENPLITAANPLLNTIPQIRHAIAHPDPTGLRQKLIDEIRRFEMQCQHIKLSYEVIIGARYCLCTALDEAAALTPWGIRSVWSGCGLLVTFHNETWGGEKFFQLLARLSQKPKENLWLLELINFCLQLGFEGRYRIMDNGRSQLETLKQRLFQLILSARGTYPQALSPALQNMVAPNKPWKSSFPIGRCILIILFLAGGLYIGLNWKLRNITKPLLATIEQTQINLFDVPANHRLAPVLPIPPTALPISNLTTMLKEEIAAGLLAVEGSSQKSVVTLHGDGLFNNGSSRIKNRYFSVLKHVAEIMNDMEGEILIIGYTDNTPIHNAYFSSNYELSLARAKSVKREFQKYLNRPERIHVKGGADSHALLPNDTQSHRAKNRRVEIILLVSPVNQTK